MTWWLLTFARRGPARYLSHLDTSRAMQRTFARAGVPLALTQGMRPKPRLSLPLPLPVGAAGCEELAVVELPDGVPAGADALRRLSESTRDLLTHADPTGYDLILERLVRDEPRVECAYVLNRDGVQVTATHTGASLSEARSRLFAPAPRGAEREPIRRSGRLNSRRPP